MIPAQQKQAQSHADERDPDHVDLAYVVRPVSRVKACAHQPGDMNEGVIPKIPLELLWDLFIREKYTGYDKQWGCQNAPSSLPSWCPCKQKTIQAADPKPNDHDQHVGLYDRWEIQTDAGFKRQKNEGEYDIADQ